MLKALNNYLSSRFPLILAISFALGLCLPYVDKTPPEILAAMLALQIFFSSFKTSVAEASSMMFRRVAGFYALRYVFLPLLAYGLATGFTDKYALAVFLLCLMPTGISAPAFTYILGGNVSLSMLLVVASSLLAPFAIPFALQAAASQTVELSTFELFTTLALIVLLPLLFHLPFRRLKPLSTWVIENNALLNMPFVAATLIIALALQRDFVFSHVDVLFVTLALSFSIFLVFYLAGWVLGTGENCSDRLTLSLSSGLNNASLGLVLASLYFRAEVATFMVMANVSWVLALLPVSMLVKRLESQDKLQLE